MKKILSLLLLVPAIWAQAQQVKGFQISGNITGLADGEVKVTTTQGQEQNIVATGMSKEGVFTVTGAIPEPGLYFLALPGEQPQYIFLENKEVRISGHKTDIKNIKIEGSSSHVDFLEFNRTFNPLIGQLNVYAADIQRAPNEKRREELTQQYDSIVQRVGEEVSKFISAKKSSYVSPFLLWVTAQLNPDPSVMEARLNMLDEEIRNSQIAKSLAEYISFNKVGSVGTDAIDFTQNDVDGNPVTLSSFKGKYVFLDFWASWCKPCRIENPNVVRVYHKFKDKNFTILGVSLDDKKEAWVKAINTDKLTWHHVSDLQSWNNSVAQMYHIQSIPGNFLIDPNGKIIARDLRGEDLDRKLSEVLGTAEVKPADKAKEGTKTKKATPEKKKA